MQTPISCPMLGGFFLFIYLFFYQCISVSRRPAVPLPGAYAKPYGLRHLTDVWEMCALTRCQRAVPVLIRHDSLSGARVCSLSLYLPPIASRLPPSAPFFLSLAV